MKFELSEEQELLQETVRGFLEAECPIARLREIYDADEPFDPALWKGMVELGLAGIALPEEYGGAQEDATDYLPLVRTYSAKDIALIHSILSGTNIRYFIRGESLTHIRPMADPAMLMVAEENVEDVKALLKDLPLSFYPLALDGGHSPEEEEKRDNTDK